MLAPLLPCTRMVEIVRRSSRRPCPPHPSVPHTGRGCCRDDPSEHCSPVSLSVVLLIFPALRCACHERDCGRLRAHCPVPPATPFPCLRGILPACSAAFAAFLCHACSRHGGPFFFAPLLGHSRAGLAHPGANLDGRCALTAGLAGTLQHLVDAVIIGGRTGLGLWGGILPHVASHLCLCMTCVCAAVLCVRILQPAGSALLHHASSVAQFV